MAPEDVTGENRKPPRPKWLKHVLIFGFAFSVLLNSPFIWLEYLKVYDVGIAPSEGVLLLAVFLIMPIVVAFVLTFPALILSVIITRVRWLAVSVALVCVMYVCAGGASIKIGHTIREKGFRDFVERSRPVIAAIADYESKNGHAPESLDALVGEYFDEVPTTGMGSAREYGYLRAGDEESDMDSTYRNSWKLYVSVSHGFVDFTGFFYLPKQNYEESGYHARLAEWAMWVD